jgi:hypothetical protein
MYKKTTKIKQKLINLKKEKYSLKKEYLKGNPLFIKKTKLKKFIKINLLKKKPLLL